ncbi:MAG: hypothetical protein N4A46_14135 [Schleiferiaceae bacterium]|jgi:hypothetical protein|nr:hypothetical protein [Schleiferiaceae bacterium]
MKLKYLLLLSSIILLFTACKDAETTEIKILQKPTMKNVAGYLDNSSFTLFTTEENREEVLKSMNASNYEKEIFKIPVFELEGEQVYMLFRITEVDEPGAFVNAKANDCNSLIFDELALNLQSMVDNEAIDLSDGFIYACGDAIGKLKGKIRKEAADKALNGLKNKNESDLERAKELDRKLKEVVNELLEMVKEAAEQAEQDRRNGDKEAAKEKAKKLAKDTEEKVELELEWDWNKFCPDYGLGLGYAYDLPVRADSSNMLTDTIINSGIRYVTYKDAECGGIEPTIDFGCRPFVWTAYGRTRTLYYYKHVEMEKRLCYKGTGFCTEQEVVVTQYQRFSDSNCSRMTDISGIKGFSCSP